MIARRILLALAFAACVGSAAPSTVHAARPASKRQPSSDIELLRLEVNYGERDSVFTVSDEGGGVFTLWYQDGRQIDRAYPLRPQDATYLLEQANLVPTDTADTQLCGRRLVQAKIAPKGSPPHEVSACLGGKSPAAQKLLDLANLMAAMF